jgi:metal-responsive CopG/Arc/MetJ family transcriptional regulator
MALESKKITTFSLDDSVLKAIDEQRGLVKRSTYVNSLLAGLLEKRKTANG